MPSVNDELLDQAVRHAIFVERFKGGLVNRLLPFLDELESDLKAQIARRDPTAVTGRFTTMRLNRLLDEVQEINALHMKGLRGLLNSEVEGLGKHETDLTRRALDTALPIKFNSLGPDANTLRAAIFSRPFQGRLLKEYTKDFEANSLSRIRQAIRIGVAEGETLGQITRRIRGRVDITRRGADLLARTAVNHTVTQAREATYRENSDVIKGVRWVSTLDGRTSDVCRARDGEVFPIDKGPRPPAHLRCRSTTVPVTKSFRELGIDHDEIPGGTRASMNGQVPARETYNDWLKKQPRPFVENILGKKKAALYLDGKMPLQKFVDFEGKPLTLDQLRKVDAEAFRLAGIDGQGPAKTATKFSSRRGGALSGRPPLKKLRADSRKYVLDNGREKGWEYLSAIDLDGRRILEQRTERQPGNVGWSPQLQAFMLQRGRRVEIHHNHPSSSSLSSADMEISALFPGIERVLAHGHDGSLYRGAAKAVPESLGNAYAVATPFIRARVIELVQSGRIDMDFGRRIWPHLVNLGMAKAGKIEYSFRLSRRQRQLFDRNKDIYEALVDRLATRLEPL